MTRGERYTPSGRVLEILRGHGTKNSIMEPSESPDEFLDRVVGKLTEIERKFSTPEEEIAQLAQEIRSRMVAGDFTPGIPTLTNAGRKGYEDASLSSCVVIPVDLRQTSEATALLEQHYSLNMGSGFNLTRYEDPVAMLLWVNNYSASLTEQGLYHRRIANMATLHVSHPKIGEFVDVKRTQQLPFFNISVEVTDEFMDAANQDRDFSLADGTKVNARELLQKIAIAAWECGDPGLINLNRMNVHNPTAETAAYECAPPCGEMGLAPGETCQFGYLNLSHYIAKDGSIVFDDLASAVALLVRVLDNAVEIGISNQPTPEGVAMANLKRKIGVSVVGLADALIKARLPYDSEEGRQFSRDLLAYINYQAKLASVALAEQRGPCGAMSDMVSNRYYDGFIRKRFASQVTKTVSPEDWIELDRNIASTGMLRNILHTALPPGGRASLILSANHSVEPIFSPTFLGAETISLILDLLAESAVSKLGEPSIQDIFDDAVAAGSFQGLNISELAKRTLRTAIEIHPLDHLRITAALAGMDGVTDECASKTVNLPERATPDEIFEIYLTAHEMGLKNISVYRDRSMSAQPRALV